MLLDDEIAPDAVGPHDRKTAAPDRPLKHLDTVVALYDFPGTQPLHLPLSLGDTVFVLSKLPTGWWDGVVVGPAGDLLRGWFPKNYTRLVNYVQPVLNKLKSNKEIDLLTAANTAANVLIPLFASLLQKNLLEEKAGPAATPRKNSVVSFAGLDSSTAATPAAATPAPEHAAHHSLLLAFPATTQQSFSTFGSHHDGSIGSAAAAAAAGSSFLTDVAEVERMVAERRRADAAAGAPFHTQFLWLPHTTTDGNLAYYNERLDVYSDQVPLTTYDAARDRDLVLETPSPDVLLNILVVASDAGAKRGSALHYLHQMHSSTELEGGATSVADGGADPDGADPNAGSDPGTKRELNAGLMHLQTSGASSLYHHFLQPLYALDGLFYRQAGDMTRWTALRQQLLFLLEWVWRALQQNDRQLFAAHFSGLNKVITILYWAVKLQQDDFVGTKYEHSIRRKLRRIAGCYLRLHTNGVLHLSVMHYDLLLTGRLFAMSMANLNKATSPAATAETSVLSAATLRRDGGEALALAQPAEAPARPADSSQAAPPHPAAQSADPASLADPAHSATSYYARLSLDVDTMRSNLDALVGIFVKLTRNKRAWVRDYNGALDTLDDEGVDRLDVLPQTHPRFIAGEFNGGNWCNPFFAHSNPILNASGDVLKSKYHQKIVIDREAYKALLDATEEMQKLSAAILAYLDPQVQHQYFNDRLKSDRNTVILRLTYKFLYYAGVVVNMLESFDFTVFSLIKRWPSAELQGADASAPPLDGSWRRNLTFDYPVVLQFFLYKQQWHDLVLEIVMTTQLLTLEDPDVFKGLKYDEPLFDRHHMKDPREKAAMLLVKLMTDGVDTSDAILLNPDVVLAQRLEEGSVFTEEVLAVVQQLIDERETILNYATRAMHDDFNVQLLVIERNNTMLSDHLEDAYYGGARPQSAGSTAVAASRRANDTPWYLEGDDEFDLLLDMKGNIKGGSKEALVAHLTHHEVFDTAFNSAFLVTFSTFMSLSDLLQLLIARFNFEAPEGLSYEEYNTWVTKKKTPICNRVLHVMQLLVEKCWTTTYSRQKGLIRRWIAFLQTAPVAHNYRVAKVVMAVLQRVLQGEVVSVEQQPVIPAGKPPAPLIKNLMLLKKKLKLLDIDYIELARQFTLMEFELYLQINKFLCICKVWGRKLGLHESIDTISTFIRLLNQLTNYVAYMILRKQDIKRRVQLIRYFVQVAEKCRQYNNYLSMTAIILALYLLPIHRLKKTWKFVLPDTLLRLQNMNKLMNLTRNFNEYRDVLKFIGLEPCVPFFGVYLSDLTFVFHGNQDYLMNRPKMINFAKRFKTYEILLGMERFKTTGYNFVVVKEIQQYLASWFDKCPTIDEQYQLSLNLEPREPVKPKKK